MPKNVNKPIADYNNKKNYSYFVRKTENSFESNSILNDDERTISRILKTTIDEKEITKSNASNKKFIFF